MADPGLHVSNLRHGYKGAPRWRDPYHCEWSIVVGDRVRRLRDARDLSLRELADALGKPEGGRYSGASLSRLERGWASAPLYVYLAIAAALEVEPGRLLGPDDVQRPVTEAELTLVRTLRRLDIAPDEAIARLAEHRRADERVS
ncbi:MAG: helix-turn-helix domain-containing protein [Actinomycetota bacterium]|nr:helix-turn-helix domain-containing protein [Actinomycetota bacterium]